MSDARVVAVTGANGYVGSIVAKAAKSRGTVVALVRTPQRSDDVAWSFADDPQALTAALRSRAVTDLVHAAWHMKAGSMSEMKRTCVAGSARLFDAARAAGVRRLIFISTISAFDEARSAYGRSKVLTEKTALRCGAVVIRLGLVYGHGVGGVFGSLQGIVRHSILVPLVGFGMAPQYLLHENTLAQVIKRALNGDFDGETRPITLAHPQPLPFREVVARIAAAENRRVILVPVPWRLLYFGVSMLERLGLDLSIRSDSLLSLIYQNREPDFSALANYRIEPAAFSDWQRPGGQA